MQEQPLEESKIYTLALNDFTAAGGDGYDMLKGAQMKGDFGPPESIFVAYLQKNGVQGVELGRITMK